LGALEELHQRYRDRVAFYVVYIKEAHPEDGWVLTMNRDEGIAVADPSTDAERVALADACVVRYAIKMPVVIDGPDNAVASAYGGWPDRLYLIGRDGRVGFQGDEGPVGFKPEELAAAIELELAGG
jgi:iodothyronine deiodinase-like protein